MAQYVPIRNTWKSREALGLDSTEKRAEYVVWALGDNNKQWAFYEHVGAGKKLIVSA
jgi:hypothetical protein